ncbi:hypothetical protein [Halorubrum lipolyticum]|uniref:Uncharacterized protein n=1 Tax=Halorubrum lipolyticum DSM 21995 TaxID=1227482 RepID=M0NR68_9EURY|nr:hypothetical protein [Halorubrum lipolyticum]EMA59709.1 hypothetical protein C469_10316 [Halorubrum lipolyticum DSM 21995]
MDRTRSVLKFVFGINVLFLILLAFSYPYLQPGTGSYVAATLTAAICLFMLALVGILSYFRIDVFGQF